MEEYVPLGRTFVEVPKTGRSADADGWANALRRTRNEQQGWDWLLRSRLVVLIDDGGAGKTTEFQARARVLNAASQTAFFLPIEKLCRHSLHQSFEDLADGPRFDRWKAGRSTAVFFLDSVDEAKLPTALGSHPLQDALRTLEAALAGDIKRCRIVISSRPSAWSPQLEPAEIERLQRKLRDLGVEEDLLDPVKPGKTRGGRWGGASATSPPRRASLVRFVAFDSLSHDQVLALSGLGPDFLATLVDTGAIAFAQTPLDVVDMAAAYRHAVEHGDDPSAPFATLSAVVDRAIERRLSEARTPKPRAGALGAQRRLAGAKRLALACVLQQSLGIRSPQGQGEGVDPLAALAGLDPEWTLPQVEQLLSTGLFQPAWQGATRFHQRRSMERLAAMALSELHVAGCPTDDLVDRLAPEAFGQRSLPVVYQETVGWLASLDDDFRHRMVEICPAVLMQFGDPGAHPPAVRLQALRGHLTLTPQIDLGLWWLSLDPLKRFAHPLLAPECGEALAGSVSPVAKRHALQIASAGRMSGLSPIVLALARDPNRTTELRAQAAAALADLGEDSDRRALAALGRAYRPTVSPGDDEYEAGRRNRLRVALLEACRPRHMPLADALALLSTLEVNPRDSNISTLNKMIAAALLRDVDAAQLERLAQGLSALSWTRVRGRLGVHDASALGWTHQGAYLMLSLEAVLERILRERPDLHDQAWLVTLVDSVVAVAHSPLGPLRASGRRDGNRLVDAVGQAPRFREAYFWAAAAQARTPDRASHDALYKLDELCGQDDGADGGRARADLEWLSSAMADHADPALRKMAIEALSWTLWRLPRGERRQRGLAMLVQAAMTGDQDVVRSVRWRPTLPVRRFLYRVRYIYARRLRDDVRELVAQRWPDLQLKLKLWLFRREVAAGQRIDLLVKALFGSGVGAAIDWDSRRIRYGESLTAALRQGVQAVAWRQADGAIVQHLELADLLSSLGWSLVALDAPARLDTVSPAQAERILSGLLAKDSPPEWAVDLALRYPRSWAQAAVPLIRLDFDQIDATSSQTSWILYHIAHLGPALRAPLAWPVLGLLTASVAPSVDQITSATDIILADPVLHPSLGAICQAGLKRAFAAGDLGQGVAWLSPWLRADAAAAWRELRRWRDTIWAGDLEMAEIFGRLGQKLESRRGDNGAGVSPIIWAQIAVDGHRHLHARDDIELSGLMQPRHYAQELRDTALRMLSSDTDPAARRALEDLLVEPVFAAAQAHIAWHLKQQAELAAAPQAWREAGVVEFCDVWTRRPRTARDLHAHVEALLRSIQKDLDSSEFDRRSLFRAAQERDVRAFVGEGLRQRGKGWFSVTQETVTRGEKRMDLRIETGDGHIVIVEIKVCGSSWPKLTLFKHLEDQLADLYLISRRVRNGIYLIVDLKAKASFDTPTGPADFEGLIAALDEHATAALAKRPQIERLSVMPFRIDIPDKKPPKPRRAAQPGGRKAATASAGASKTPRPSTAKLAAKTK